MEISAKTAFISGGASGLGEATARMIHQGGGNVMLFALNAERGAALAGELVERAGVAQGDGQGSGQLADAVAKGMARFGALHVCIVCEGSGPPARGPGRGYGRWARRRRDRPPGSPPGRNSRRRSASVP